MENKLKQLRLLYGLSQNKAASILNIPLRTYIRYEQDSKYGDINKREMLIKKIEECTRIDESHGILSISSIKDIVNGILSKHKDDVLFCYLFGSYAKGYAKDNSDVDLCVSTSLTGFNFIGLIEELRTSLNKKVDLIRLSDLKIDDPLLNEIMKDGIKIYG